VGEFGADSNVVEIVAIRLVCFASAYTPVPRSETMEWCVPVGPPRDGGVEIKGDDDDVAEYVECVPV
jgi:hypothetical protein